MREKNFMDGSEFLRVCALSHQSALDPTRVVSTAPLGQIDTLGLTRGFVPELLFDCCNAREQSTDSVNDGEKRGSGAGILVLGLPPLVGRNGTRQIAIVDHEAPMFRRPRHYARNAHGLPLTRKIRAQFSSATNGQAPR